MAGVNSLSQRNNICPKCGAELTTITLTHPDGSETKYQYCYKCGYRSDNFDKPIFTAGC